MGGGISKFICKLLLNSTYMVALDVETDDVIHTLKEYGKVYTYLMGVSRGEQHRFSNRPK